MGWGEGGLKSLSSQSGLIHATSLTVTNGATTLLNQDFTNLSDSDILTLGQTWKQGATVLDDIYKYHWAFMKPRNLLYNTSGVGVISTLVRTEASNYSSVSVETGFNRADDDFVGVVFRYADANNYYQAGCQSEDTTCYISKYVAGTETIIGQVGFSQIAYVYNVLYQNNTAPNRIRVVANGTNIKMYFKELLILDVDDSQFSSGRVGITNASTAGVWFYYFKVSLLN